ncbi:MAG: acetyl-CoA carboxylase biotin carboxyl carrier protein subunit [Bacteroidetes bacterium GWF2_33_16]|nr:MAG: acetyl-CoA carboxylase biotin carboxyl carrier protein subunit [Bacteroidetes bacterium GWE2_32_14]OFY06966.1 MAG: acetyl-CoA carboxylase biotin carboxyl carrier protein subunit [Bacteroidetes bacterium GWF2_33_16]
MKKYKFTIRGNDYDVEIKEVEGNIAKIEVNGTAYEVQIHNKEIKTSKTPTIVRANVPVDRKDSKIKKSVSSRGHSVKAPLPGSIFKVLKQVGDEVKKGDAILIMEAMKMENKITAEKDGTIISMKVKEGDTVLQNDVLAEIE